MPLFADSELGLTCHVVLATPGQIGSIVTREDAVKYVTPLPPTFKLSKALVAAIAAGELSATPSASSDVVNGCQQGISIEAGPGSPLAGVKAEEMKAWASQLEGELRSGSFKEALRSRMYWLSEEASEGASSAKGGNLRRKTALPKPMWNS